YDLPIWKTNNGTQGGTGTALSPSAGNTYTLNSNNFPVGNNLGNARIRNNVTNSGAIETFAGDSLTLTTNTEIRFKRITVPSGVDPTVNFPGVGGNPGLIFRGGVVNPGDDMRVTIAGKV